MNITMGGIVGGRPYTTLKEVVLKAEWKLEL